MSLTENNSTLKAKIEQTRQAREAFLRGTTVTSISNSSINPTASVTNSSSATNQPSSKTSYSNREMVNDKANVIASLGSNGSNSHFYQNIQNLKSDQLNQNGTTVSSKTNGSTTPTNGLTNGLISSPLANGVKALTPGKTPPTSITTSKQRNLDGYVGFANLPNQVYRKSVKKGFEFNLMVIGESGLGKSTFINSLFLTELYNPDDFPGTFERRNKKTTFVDSTSVTLNEKGVNLRLTIVDTPGFGDSIDNTNCWQPITDHIDAKYEEYLSSESKVNRQLPINDQRIHCCLFFISAGHTLKQLDIEVMKKLHDRVNLIPVIAKADTMTTEEVKQFKKVVLDVIAENKIQIYEFPDIDDDDIENNRTNSILKSKLPFAIVGSNKLIDSEGKTFRGRKYPWGVVNVDELAHCDFMALRTMLIRTHMHDLKDVTNNVHYENYRFKKLAYVTGDKTKPTNKNPFQQLEEEKKEAEQRLEKMKNEMEGVFDQKVKEKISRLRESELNLEKQQEAMRQSLEKEEKELEEKRLVFLREKQLWEEANKEEEDRLKHTLDKEADKKKKKMF
jgi:septin 7